MHRVPAIFSVSNLRIGSDDCHEAGPGDPVALRHCEDDRHWTFDAVWSEDDPALAE